jgi:TPR repeat protein
LVDEGFKLKNQRKFEQAFKMFEQAGNRGYARGWSHLIGLYSEEKGVKRDEREMAKLVELVKDHLMKGMLLVNVHWGGCSTMVMELPKMK